MKNSTGAATFNIGVWKQANRIFEDLLGRDGGLADDLNLAQFDSIEPEVRQALINIIEASSESTEHIHNLTAALSKGFKSFRTNFKSGQAFNEYLILEQIGQGGMSQVFSAMRTHSELQKKGGH